MNEHAPWTEPLPPIGYDASLCPLCGSKTEVTKKTKSRREGMLIRYRRCLQCAYRCKTVELLVLDGRVSLKPPFESEEKA